MSNNSQSGLSDVIRQHIADSPQQRITFAEFMEIALYHAELGYYSTQGLNLGKEGDFFTSVHLGADFGEIIAEQFVEMWEIFNRPAKFTLVEMGAGQGLLAVDILKYLQTHHRDFWTALTYTIVEKSSGLRQLQQQNLGEFNTELNQELNQSVSKVTWCDLEAISSHSIIGCIFSNELVDALPVHQFIVTGGEIKEIYVTVQENEFVEILDNPSTPELINYLQSFDFDIRNFPEGYRSEINLSARNWLKKVSQSLQQGYVITIDYGYPAHRYYNPRRTTGTLQCYFRHQRHDNPYINVGLQDITTHINFTALENWGADYGLKKIGFTQQALFLMALGLGDRIAGLSHSNLPLMDLLKRRDYLQQLIDPMGLGGFGVLVQGKNVPPQLIRGLQEP